MQLFNGTFTVGDVRKYTIDYSEWLPCNTGVAVYAITSSSVTLTVTGTSKNLGRAIEFYIGGGVVGEKATISIAMTDTTSQIKNDTMVFTVINP